MRTYEITWMGLSGIEKTRVEAQNKETALKTLVHEHKRETPIIFKVEHLKKSPACRFYVCYGSNLNTSQMRFRCPDSKVYGAGVIKNYRLSFYNVASIEPAPGTDCPVGVWKISKNDEVNLDRYEGYPRLYRKETVPVVMESGETIEAMVYIMNRSGAEYAPSRGYYETIYSGYLDFGLDTSYLEQTVKKFNRQPCFLA